MVDNCREPKPNSRPVPASNTAPDVPLPKTNSQSYPLLPIGLTVAVSFVVVAGLLQTGARK